ncbi:hypothetical protein [Actinoalloteichus spitiensis]|uniref:hypothetical protein n=1 Tax=Actinoalloteichus spitiensis TaxID=252394 RepID=UPI000474C905|nr:hypothetical protein [Actinoalloteichus spitiensis]
MGSTLYCRSGWTVACSCTRDPHMAQGDGEVALTAREGSLRATVRLPASPPGGDAPRTAFTCPFAEAPEHWIPFGLSGGEGEEGGWTRRCVTRWRSWPRGWGWRDPVADAYLSAAADFAVSQVVDRTTGISG